MIEDKISEMENFENHAHFEDSAIAVAPKQVSRSKGKTFGIVAMGKANFYTETAEENKDRHIAVPVKDFIQKLNEFLCQKGAEVLQITAGHEHGDSKGRCHYQVCVELASEYQKYLKPGCLEVNGTEVLFMFQKARNAYALKTYCKKEGQFEYLFPDKAIKNVYKVNAKGESTGKIEPYATIVNNKELMSSSDALDLVLSHDPMRGITQYKNIEYALEAITKPQLPELRWEYPEHFKGIVPEIEAWFHKWCVPEGLERRKGLCLYSAERAMGKTRFAQSLVNHEDYSVVFRNTFTQAALKGKSPKLLILDDMGFYTQDNKETWKALIAGQKTSIRDCYANFLWNYEVPCIITTNNENLFINLMASDEFKTQLVFVEVGYYMGPPGTEPKDMHTFETVISNEMAEKVQKKIKEREENKGNAKFLGKKTMNSDFDAYMRAATKLQEQDDLIRKLKEELKELKKKNK